MNFAAFLIPLLQELVSVVGPTVLSDINNIVGDIASKNGHTLAPTPAHTNYVAPAPSAPVEESKAE